MLFPDQSPILLIGVVVALLAVALLAAARDLLSRNAAELACPKCGVAFDEQRWARHNERTMYHGRYTITPHYTCPRCGEAVRQKSA
jgi:predicted RNA-binding Zn-ribbon protein involved in translation (DUF1610 family)